MNFDALVPYWKQIDVFSRGLKDVQKYLLDLDVNNPNCIRNLQYKKAAKYTNYLGRTIRTLTAAAFKKPHTVENVIIDIDSIVFDIFANVLKYGKCVVIVGKDTVQVRHTADMTEYKKDKYGKLKHAEFGETEYILEGGVALYRECENEPFAELLNYNGQRLDYLPVFLIELGDTPPLWALCDLNQGHYQNSADYEDLLRKLTPTPYVTVPNSHWRDEMYPDGIIEFGSGAVIPVPEGGTAGILQGTPNQMHKEAMLAKEEAMLAIGARMLARRQTGNKETATSARIQADNANEDVMAIVDVIEPKIIEIYTAWQDINLASLHEFRIVLNREFSLESIDTELLNTQIKLLANSVIGVTDIRENLREKGVLNRTDEEIDAEIQKRAEALLGDV